MVIYNSFKNDKLVELIKAGGVGILPTDTLYGIVCSAFDKEAVEHIYEVKGRDEGKPLIILISSKNDLVKFGLKQNILQNKQLDDYWPGKVSVILPSFDDRYNYLSRGHKTLTFRFPADHKLVALLQKTGPLVAPSANPQGLTPATNIDEAMNYFIGKVDFGVDGGEMSGNASTLVDLTGAIPKVMRQGDVKV